ncbi:hypothetical protein AWM75_07945 [Aerococcus urinaehominis]|uniref:Uncharacterized protein n=1 Tax=Aerococcus urinaehominis TaxID=128944 RepID=A0A0X8FMP5_9LACT|nr:hypothetical protein AWM75_07945 [Aerococcus urinaehominis]
MRLEITEEEICRVKKLIIKFLILFEKLILQLQIPVAVGFLLPFFDSVIISRLPSAIIGSKE